MTTVCDLFVILALKASNFENMDSVGKSHLGAIRRLGYYLWFLTNDSNNDFSVVPVDMSIQGARDPSCRDVIVVSSIAEIVGRDLFKRRRGSI